MRPLRFLVSTIMVVGAYSNALSQQFCLETFEDFQAHFTSLFGGDSRIDAYGNVFIDGQTGGRGGWPSFRLSDVEVTITPLPEGAYFGGDQILTLAQLDYRCTRGACINTKMSPLKVDSAYTMMDAERAERCFELMRFLQDNPDIGE